MQKANGKQTPKQALQEWVRKHDLTIKDFADKLGYTYSYAWQLLSDSGKRDVSFELIGRMAVFYGCGDGVQIVSKALRESLEQSA